MARSIKRFLRAIRKNPDVFVVGVLSINMIPLAIFLHYVLNHNVQAVVWLSVAYVFTQLMAARA